METHLRLLGGPTQRNRNQHEATCDVGDAKGLQNAVDARRDGVTGYGKANAGRGPTGGEDRCVHADDLLEKAFLRDAAFAKKPEAEGGRSITRETYCAQTPPPNQP